MERTANTRPESIGVTAVWEFTVEGDVMKTRVVSGKCWRRGDLAQGQLDQGNLRTVEMPHAVDVSR